MPPAVHYFETGSLDPYYNLAFEEFLLRNHTGGNILMLWQNENTIVIGKNQNAEAEINHAFVNAHGITVARRITGGGAVYHDLGNLNYSIITDTGDSRRMAVEYFTRPIVAALKGLGMDAEASGRNDILVEGRKVSGTAQCIIGNRILHHGTLLFDSDPSMVSGALNVDPSKYKSKSTKSVKSRIGNIRDFLPEGIDMDTAGFRDYLKKTLAGDGFSEEQLSPDELEAVTRLRNEKYAAWEWNFGRSPKFDLVNKKRFAAGGLEIGVHAEQGIIKEIKFYGDFLSLSPVEPLEEALCGSPFRREDAASVLKGFPLMRLFGGITEDEILDTIFNAADAGKE